MKKYPIIHNYKKVNCVSHNIMIIYYIDFNGGRYNSCKNFSRFPFF